MFRPRNRFTANRLTAASYAQTTRTAWTYSANPATGKIYRTTHLAPTISRTKSTTWFAIKSKPHCS